MSACLKIGNRLLDSDQIIAALVQYQILETLVEQMLLDDVIYEIPLSKQELLFALVGSTDVSMPEDFDGFLAQWCQHQNVTPAYLNGVILRQLRVEKFKQLQFADQVESEFLRAKSTFDQVEYSLIQLADWSLAQELYFQLRDDGTEFAQLVEQYSVGNERQSQGRIGPVPMSTLPVEVAKLFRTGQEGGVYGPIQVADRIWVVRLERLRVAHLTEATRSSLINQLYTQWLQSQVKALIATPGAIAYGEALPSSAPGESSELAMNEALIED